MALQPNPPTKIRKGKAPGAFAGFVDTFNWMVDFCTNLCGEGEQSSQGSSTIYVDRSVSDHPVIRGGGSGGGSAADDIVIEGGDDTDLKVVKYVGEDGKTHFKIDVYWKA